MEGAEEEGLRDWETGRVGECDSQMNRGECAPVFAGGKCGNVKMIPSFNRRIA